MKTRRTFSAAAILAVLTCSAAHAQVLGGNVGGAVNGALGGGLRDTSVFSNGNAAGSFGSEFDTGPVLKKTRGIADDTTGRARDAGSKVRNRAESTVATARDTSANTATSAVATARTVKDQQVSAAADGAASHSTAIEPQHVSPSLGSITSDVDGSASGNASASRHGVVADAVADGNAAASLAENKQVEAQQETPATDGASSDRNDKR
jgi:hypothetical protein